MFKNLVKLLGKLSRIHIEAQSIPNSMVSRALYMHSQLAQANENALVSNTSVADLKPWEIQKGNLREDDLNTLSQKIQTIPFDVLFNEN